MLLRSAAVGIVATAVDVGALFLLIEGLGIPAVWANVPTLTLGMAVQYVGNKYVAFRDTSRDHLRQGGLFLLVGIGTLLLSAVGFHLLVTLTTIPFGLARPLVALVVYLAFSFPLWGRIFKTAGVTMSDDEATFDIYLKAVRHMFARSRRQVEQAVGQLSDEQLHYAPGPESNSVAVTMKHITGNQLSRWTDFLTSDGEKPWRKRDTEFVEDARSRDEILAHWARGWAVLEAALGGLEPADLKREVRVRGRAMTVMGAIEGQVQHYGYHAGQIAYVARMLKGDDWETLSIPRGGSDAHNRSMGHLPD